MLNGKIFTKNFSRLLIFVMIGSLAAGFEGRLRADSETDESSQWVVLPGSVDAQFTQDTAQSSAQNFTSQSSVGQSFVCPSSVGQNSAYPDSACLESAYPDSTCLNSAYQSADGSDCVQLNSCGQNPPCVMTRNAASLGYPWVRVDGDSEADFCFRAQNEDETPSFPADALSSTFGDSSSQFSGESFSKVRFSPEEERYHYWDPSLHACVPGLGRPLPTSNEAWSWQILPGGTLYRAHFASNRESRLGIHFINENTTHDAYWDPTLGGRINLLRYGTQSRIYPEGVQLDVECAAIARLTLKGDRDLQGTDYRFGLPLTFRKENWEFKIGYYHISSHMGDEWMVKHYEATGEVYRINYVRDCVMWGIAYRPDANWRFYLGGDFVFYRDCGAEPLQFELGAEYSPMMLPNFQGSPFLAVHFRWSEDTDFETYSALEAGWQWKTIYQQTMRTGLYAMSGYADQYQFYNRWEKQIGVGFWYDF